MKEEENYVKEKIPEYWHWIDIEARNCFSQGVGVGMLKCVTGYNHYDNRNKVINSRLVENKCPRCNADESWEHVILCPGANKMKSIYFRTLKEDIKKIKNIEHLDHMIDLIFTDLKSYLYNDKSEGVTAQWFVGMHQVF